MLSYFNPSSIETLDMYTKVFECKKESLLMFTVKFTPINSLIFRSPNDTIVGTTDGSDKVNEVRKLFLSDNPPIIQVLLSNA